MAENFITRQEHVEYVKRSVYVIADMRLPVYMIVAK